MSINYTMFLTVVAYEFVRRLGGIRGQSDSGNNMSKALLIMTCS